MINVAAATLSAKPTKSIRLRVTTPDEKAMAFGAVAIGNMNAKLAAIAIENPRVVGSIPTSGHHSLTVTSPYTR